MGLRRDTFQVSVWVEGIGPLGVWGTRTGGEFDSDEVKYRPGGMQPMVSLGGNQTINNVIVGRIFDTFIEQRLDRLIAARGKARMSITMQGLDKDGNAFAQVATTWTGTLKQVTLPEHDSESNDAALIELEMTSESVSTQGVAA